MVGGLETLPTRLVVALTQAGPLEPMEQLGRLDGKGAELDRPNPICRLDVVVVALKTEAALAELLCEVVELVVRHIGDEVGPHLALKGPDRRVDEHGHTGTVSLGSGADAPRPWTCETASVTAATDEVLLRIPAQPEYGRIVRVGAAALGIRQGLSFAEIDDLRLAIDEAVILLLTAAPTETEISAVFRFDDGRLELELACTEPAVLTDGAIGRFATATGSLIDDYDIEPARGWLRLRKTPV